MLGLAGGALGLWLVGMAIYSGFRDRAKVGLGAPLLLLGAVVFVLVYNFLI